MSENPAQVVEKTVRGVLQKVLFWGRRIHDRRVAPLHILLQGLLAENVLFELGDCRPFVFEYAIEGFDGNRLSAISVSGNFNGVHLDLRMDLSSLGNMTFPDEGEFR